jgi:hypothetical protein
MHKALFAAFAAAAILFLGAPADRAAAMTIASPSAIGIAAAESSSLQQVHYRGWHRRYWVSHYGVWQRPECGLNLDRPNDWPCGYGYNPGPYWGLGGYLNSWYM